MNSVYILYRAGLYKIGISKDVKNRIRRIQKAKLVFYLPFIFAARYERFLHNRYRHLRVKNGRESGCTEWFKFWLPVRPVLWLLLFFGLEWGSLIFLIWI